MTCLITGIITCSTGPVADLGNSSVLFGKAYGKGDSAQTAAAGATVELRAYHSLALAPVTGKRSLYSDTLVYRTVTDTDGSFRIDSIADGVYTLLICLDSTVMGITDSVLADGTADQPDTADDLDLRPPVKVYGRVNWKNDSVRAYIAVCGTGFTRSVESDGSFRFERLPAGNLRFKCILYRDGQGDPDTTDEFPVDIAGQDSVCIDRFVSSPELLSEIDTLVRVSHGENCTLSVPVNGVEDCMFIWYRDSVPVDTTDTCLLVFSQADESIAGSYYCRIVNRWGEVASRLIEVRVVPLFSVTLIDKERSGGDSLLSADRYETGEKIVLAVPPDSTVAPGYVFNSWNTTADGSGSSLAPGDTMTIDTTAIVLYAVWEALPRHRVFYDANGGSGPVPVDTLTYYASQIIPVREAAGSLARAGHSFTGWNTLSGGDGTGCPPDSQLVMSDTDIVLFAQWQRNSYLIYFHEDNDTAIDGTDTVLYGDPAAAPADPVRTGSVFGGWFRDAGYTLPWDFSADTVYSDVDLYAQWRLEKYAVVYNISGGGVIDGPDSVEYGVAAHVKGIPSKGYVFDHWNAGASEVSIADSSDAETEITGSAGSVVVNAVFVLRTYTLEVTAQEHGTISERPGTAVTHGDTATVSAVADQGYHFSGWKITSGYAVLVNSFSATTGVVMDSGDASITATFEINRYRLDRISQHGTIDAPDSAEHGEAVTVTAVADFGYRLTQWTADSGTLTIADPDSVSTTVIMENGDARIRAGFGLKEYALTVTHDDSGSTSGGGTVKHGEQNRVVAVAAEGYRFVKWAGVSGRVLLADSLDDSTFALLTDGDASIRAHFERNVYQVVVASSDNGSAGATGTTLHGDPYQITAHADSHYHFDHWRIVSGTVAIADSSRDTTTVRVYSAGSSVEALFVIDEYGVTAETAGQGSVNGAGSAPYGDTLALEAVPAHGYLFDHWEPVSGDVWISDVSNSAVKAFLSSAATLRAVFIPMTYTLSLASSDGGTVAEEGTVISVQHGIPFTVTAIPEAQQGYHFDHWVAETPNVTIENTGAAVTAVSVVDSNAAVSATFALNNYHFTIKDTAGNGAGSVICRRIDTSIMVDGDIVTHNEVITIQANPAASSVFTVWRVTGSNIVHGDSTAVVRSVEIRDSVGCIDAVFSLKQYSLTVVQPSDPDSGVLTAQSLICEHGLAYSISAIPGPQFRFVAWAGQPTDSVRIINPGSAEATIVLTGNGTVSARFERIPFILTETAVGEGCGTITIGSTAATGHDTLLHSIPQTLHAHPCTGSRFIGWHTGPEVTVVGDHDGDSITVMLDHGNGSLTAEFALQEYSFFLVADSGGITRPAAGALYTVRHGRPFTVMAVADTLAGYMVDAWRTLADDDSRCRLTMFTGDSCAYIVLDSIEHDTLAVHFRKRSYTLAIVPPAGDSGVITLPAVPSLSVEHGQNIPITAVPAVGFDSLRWTVRRANTVLRLHRSAAVPDTVTLFSGDDTLTASFRSINYRIRIVVDNPLWGATVPADSIFVNHFRTENITAVPVEGYRFTSMTTSSPQINVLPVNATVMQITTTDTGTATAHFIRIVDTLTVHHSDSGNLPAADEVHHLDYMDPVTITAQPLPEYDFSHWQTVIGTVYYRDGFDNTMAEAEVYCRGENAELVPVFTLKRYALTVTNNKPDSAQVTAPQVIEHGNVYTCSAVTSYPLRFAGWTTSTPDSIVITDAAAATTSFICTGNAQLNAGFEYYRYPVVLSISDPDGASFVTSITEIEYGREEVISVNVNGGYEFVSWNVLQNGIGLSFPDGQSSPTVRLVYRPPVFPTGEVRIEAGIRQP